MRDQLRIASRNCGGVWTTSPPEAPARYGGRGGADELGNFPAGGDQPFVHLHEYRRHRLHSFDDLRQPGGLPECIVFGPPPLITGVTPNSASMPLPRPEFFNALTVLSAYVDYKKLAAVNEHFLPDD